MENINKKILREYTALYAYRNTLNNQEENYEEYWDNIKSNCTTALGNIETIIKFQEQYNDNISHMDRIVSHISTIKLTPYQLKQLTEIRSNPFYKKIVGEIALYKKDELEKLLGVEINNRGNQFADEKGIIEANKSVKQLVDEQMENVNKLDDLFDSGQISQSLYEKYDHLLENIYTYYISISKGEQIKYRKISDEEYEKNRQEDSNNIEKYGEHYAYGIEDNAIIQDTIELKEEHENLQRLQEEVSNRNK